MATAGLTFIIPAFNAEQTLNRALQSLVRQTTPLWNAIVIDDGSTDATGAIAQSWSERDPRVRVLTQRNEGVAAARNAGVAAAADDFLAFLDADDTVSRSYTQAMLGALEADGRADAACCGSARMSRLGDPIEYSAAPRLDLTPWELCRHHAPAPLNALVLRRRRVQDLRGFDTDLRSYEDWDLWMRLVGAGVRFVVLPQRLAQYWCTHHSLTTDGAEMMRGLRIVAARSHTASRDDSQDESTMVAQAEFRALFWNAGIAIGRGGSPASVVHSWHGAVDLPAEKHEVATAFLRGLAIGCECPVEDVVNHWAVLQAGIADFLAKVEARLEVPGAAYALLKALEREVLRGNGRRKSILSSTVGVTIGLHGLLLPVTVAPAIDSVAFRLPGTRALLDVPVWGTVCGVAETWRAVRAQGMRLVVSAERTERLLGNRPVRAAERLAQKLWHRLRALRSRQARTPDPAVTGPAPQPRVGSMRLGTEAVTAAQVIIAAEQAAIDMDPPRVTARNRTERLREPFNLSGADLVEAWERFYATTDPWNYGSAYEQLKYERTLGLIPPGRVGRVLELGCSEGHFTQLLAGRADFVRAVDISQTALARAAERCRSCDNVTFVAADVFNSPIEGQWDLITVSEMLYHIDDAALLPAFLARLRDALVPGGHLLQTHAFDVAVTPGRTGFDWAGTIDGQSTADMLRATPGLFHHRALETDLYRIDLFCRGQGGGAVADAEIVPLGTPLAPSLESLVIWNGAIARRAELETERAVTIPVLMYHRIADDGPAALAPYRTAPKDFAEQIRFLRRRGFRSITPEEWQDRRGVSLIGRPVMITFDDAYQDFHDEAFPILRRNGFSAHVFVPTGKVGGVAEWDARYGTPAPLMDWSAIAELASEGITFGSHLVSHQRADCLDSEALLKEAARSRAALEAVVRAPVTTVAPPFGICDKRICGVLAQAGYRQGFLDRSGPASVLGLSLAVPRIEIVGGDDLDTFAAKLGMTAFPPERGDRIS